MAQIAVIGAGYVGLTTAACFSHLGHDVVCACRRGRVTALSKGEVPIVEAGLDAIVAENLLGRLRFVLGAENAAKDAEFAYLCVPTPQGEDGSADLSYIETAARQIGPVLPAEAVVINKSTVPVGLTRAVERVFAATTWSSCPTPSSCARARRSTTSSTPTASSSAATTSRRPCVARCTSA